jgi:hypothetical protein
MLEMLFRSVEPKFDAYTSEYNKLLPLISFGIPVAMNTAGYRVVEDI